jgi:hypothetical protein
MEPMAIKMRRAIGVAIILAAASAGASAAVAATPYDPAELRQCVANMDVSAGGIGSRDLDAMAPTEYEVRLGRCMNHLERLYRRQPRR